MYQKLPKHVYTSHVITRSSNFTIAYTSNHEQLFLHIILDQYKAD